MHSLGLKRVRPLKYILVRIEPIKQHAGGHPKLYRHDLHGNYARYLLAIIDLRREYKDRFPSNREIATRLQVRETAVATAIRRLRSKSAITGRSPARRLAKWVVDDRTTAGYCLLLLDYLYRSQSPTDEPVPFDQDEFLRIALRDRRLALDGDRDRHKMQLMCMSVLRHRLFIRTEYSGSVFLESTPRLRGMTTILRTLANDTRSLHSDKRSGSIRFDGSLDGAWVRL